MYPQYICTRVYPHKSPVYVHQTNSVDTHPHARIHIYIQSIHTNLCTKKISMYTSVYIAYSLSWYYPHAVILVHTLPNTALITPLLRVWGLFVDSCLRNMAHLAKAPCIKRSVSAKDPCISAKDPCISVQEPCISAPKKHSADTHISYHIHY